jgi:hypothetical protein
MNDIVFIWDLDDDPDGNVQHIAEHGLTKEEYESVFDDPAAVPGYSRSSGLPIMQGTTSSGLYVVVVYEHVDDDPLTVYPVTAYPPGG